MRTPTKRVSSIIIILPGIRRAWYQSQELNVQHHQVAVEKELKAWETFVSFYYIGAHLPHVKQQRRCIGRGWHCQRRSFRRGIPLSPPTDHGCTLSKIDHELHVTKGLMPSILCYLPRLPNVMVPKKKLSSSTHHPSRKKNRRRPMIKFQSCFEG